MEKLKQFYKNLLEQVPDVIFQMVHRTDGTNYVAYISERVNDLYELTVDEIINDIKLLYQDRILKEDIETVVSTLQHSIATGEKWETEFRVMLPVKGLKYCKMNATPQPQPDGTIHYFGRVTDITEQKEQQIKLRKSSETMEFALDAASEGVWDWDMNNDIAHLRPQSMKIIGLDGYWSGSPLFWTDRIHPDDAGLREKAKKKGFHKQDTVYESIYRIRTEDGRYRWVQSRGRSVEFDAKGKPTRAVGIHKDITEIREKEIELANTISIISSQNNRLSNFAHIVSHNLRSHASNLKMLIDLFKTAGEKERQEMMEHLESISDGLSVTISHLKELVEIQFEVKTTREKLNLRSYLKNILNILHNEITKHGVTIEVNIPLDVTVDYNPAYLESILLNFTTNAIKYSSPDRKPMLMFDFSIVDGKKILSVTDNGLGIDLKKHKNSLFGMYKTFHKHQNSRGIGLFITKNQVEAMGGRIEVTSEVNRGTTFKIFFNEED